MEKKMGNKPLRSIPKKTAQELWESSEASSDSIFSFSSSTEEESKFPSTEEDRKISKIVYTALSKMVSEEELPLRWKKELRHPRREILSLEPTSCSYYFPMALWKLQEKEGKLSEASRVSMNHVLENYSNDVLREIVRLVDEGKEETWREPPAS